MNILIITSVDPYNKAGSVANDLLIGFKKNGKKNIKIFTKSRKYANEDVISYNNIFDEFYDFLTKIILKFAKLIPSFEKNKVRTDNNYLMHEISSIHLMFNATRLFKKLKYKPDMIIILFTHNFINYKHMSEIYSFYKAPIFLYMMDMAPLTGGCHYAWDCKGYENSCGKCPGLYSDDPHDQTFINWRYKKEYIDKTNIIPIAASEWQFKQLKKSSLFLDKNKYKVFLSIDSKLFKPIKKTSVREELKIPNNKKVIFFGAVNIAEKRKGFKELIDALLILNHLLGDKRSDRLHLLIAGNKSVEFSFLLPFSSTFLGFLSQKQLPKAFQSADIYLSPSIEDSGPMMINQSIMCGTPVVSFEMGVALDLVITGQTGYRAKLGDSEDLARGIKYIVELNDSECAKMSENCRKLGLELLDPTKQAKQFIDILRIFKQ